MAEPRALILGLAGPVLEGEEKALLSRADPWGVILFARNIRTPAQVADLVAEIRATLGRDAPVLIDQEGGPVQRLRPPHWRAWEAPAETAARGAEAMRLRHRLIASELHALGIDTDCAPCLDLSLPETHGVIGRRAYGSDPETVARLGRIACEGLRAGGVLPVIKHIPGHGRATADSHLELPRVETPLATLLAEDFRPFAALADQPMAMTAHILFTAIDAERPVTLSPRAIGMIRAETGFDGLMMTDDLGMQALSGTLAERAEASLAAGCDLVLHCSGRAEEAEDLAEVVPRLTDRAAERAHAALACRRAPEPLAADAWADWDALTAEPAHA